MLFISLIVGVIFNNVCNLLVLMFVKVNKSWFFFRIGINILNDFGIIICRIVRLKCFMIFI